jgi:hypothetical protein
MSNAVLAYLNNLAGSPSQSLWLDASKMLAIVETQRVKAMTHNTHLGSAMEVGAHIAVLE